MKTIFNDTLTRILLSEHAAETFTSEYRGNAQFRSSVDALIPEVSACYARTQRGVWHIYNVMDHILHAVDEMNTLTAAYPYNERKLLAYTMFLHDLGKPAYHRVQCVDGVEIDRFPFHHLGSEAAAARILPALDFAADDAAIVVTLVREHDVFLKFDESPTKPWQMRLTSDALKTYIATLDTQGNGARIFEYLILVGTADNKAQNPMMTQQALAKIDKIKTMGRRR